MRKLDRFTFHEGTTDNPVVLSSTQIKTLVNMINDENFVYDFGGYVTSENGIFTKGEYNQLTFAGFNVIYTTLTPDEFSVEPVNPEINEGESTKLITNGVISKLVKFEISNVSVKDNVITNSEFKSRCSVDDNGILHVAPAEENLDWEAEVNILAYPSYSSKSEGRSCTVKVKAIKITEIFFDSSVPEIVDKIIPTTLVIKPYPDNNTKTYTVTFSAINGIIDGSFYSSNNNLEDTITATANVLGNTLTVSKDIIVDEVILNDSIKNPVVFASLKQAFNLSDDVHEFKISDAKQTTNDQVNNFLKILASNNNDNLNLFTLNELKYFNCTVINVINNNSGYECRNITEVTFPDNLLELKNFFYNMKVTDINFNNCKNPVKLFEGYKYTARRKIFLSSIYPFRFDLTNVSEITYCHFYDGDGILSENFTDFILGENTKYSGGSFITSSTNKVNGYIIIDKEEFNIPNFDYFCAIGGYPVLNIIFNEKSNVNNIICNITKKINYGAFSGLAKLKTINGYPNVPHTVTFIGQYAFNNCKSIEFNELPSEIITLEDYAFNNCVSIPYMDLSNCTILYNSNTAFNARCFEGCTSLAYIKLPSIGSVIPATNISSLPVQTNIYVPDNLVDSYKSATNWNSIASRIHGYSEM